MGLSYELFFLLWLRIYTGHDGIYTAIAGPRGSCGLSSLSAAVQLLSFLLLFWSCISLTNSHTADKKWRKWYFNSFFFSTLRLKLIFPRGEISSPRPASWQWRRRNIKSLSLSASPVSRFSYYDNPRHHSQNILKMSVLFVSDMSDPYLVDFLFFFSSWITSFLSCLVFLMVCFDREQRIMFKADFDI